VNLVDSSGWIEFVLGESNAAGFQPALQDTDSLVIPTIVAYEVSRYLRRFVSDDAADGALARMQESRIASLDIATANEAAHISLEHQLPMADSIILATARAFDAALWTQDAHFASIPGVRYIPKK
jgi:predicted nucleic acid-binding protein